MREIFLSSLLLIVLGSCHKDSNPTGPSIPYEFSINLLEDSTITVDSALQVGLSQLKVSEKPWLSGKDIQYYDFSSHCIYLKAQRDSLFPNLVNGQFPGSWWAKPFVVLASGQRRYLGVFHSGFLSKDWTLPYIEDWQNILRYPKDIIYISWIYLLDADEDKRNDPVIRETLRQLNILHPGIAVSFDSVAITRTFDSSTVTYAFSISNNDDDDLYLPDPDLMGSALFHYYNTGPEIVNSTGTNVYRSTHKSVVNPQPFNSWKSEWFVRLRSRATIKRVISLSGYPYIPPGDYACEFQYSGPVNIEQNQRLLADGRYWIGPAIPSVHVTKVQ